MTGPLILRGTVTKNGVMNRTATVTVWRWVVHKRTGKRLQLSKKYLTHDPDNMLKMEDEVQIINCPPVSARKRFALKEIMDSPELKRESIRKGADYQKALTVLNNRREVLESKRRALKEREKLKEMEEARSERIESERRRGEEKKALREKTPFVLAAEAALKENAPRVV